MQSPSQAGISDEKLGGIDRVTIFRSAALRQIHLYLVSYSHGIEHEGVVVSLVLRRSCCVSALG